MTDKVFVINNKKDEKPKFEGKKRQPKKVSIGVPTEQQKFYIYKNYTEPALLKKKEDEDSDIVKSIKEALGIKNPDTNLTNVDSSPFEDVANQQLFDTNERNVRKKLRKERIDNILNQKELKRIEEEKNNSAIKLQSFIKTKIAVDKFDASLKLQSAVKRRFNQDKLNKTTPLFDENNKRIGIYPHSYFRGGPTKEEKKLKDEIERRRNEIFENYNNGLFLE